MFWCSTITRKSRLQTAGNLLILLKVGLMSRDFRKLNVFQIADDVAVEISRAAKSFPNEERYGLQSQLRRAAVSSAANIVEGCARKTPRDYLNVMSISLGASSEVRYLFDLSHRLGFLSQENYEKLAPQC